MIIELSNPVLASDGNTEFLAINFAAYEKIAILTHPKGVTLYVMKTEKIARDYDLPDWVEIEAYPNRDEAMKDYRSLMSAYKNGDRVWKPQERSITEVLEKDE